MPDDLAEKCLQGLLGESLIADLAPEKIEEVYNMAYTYYQNRYYQEADALFRILVSMSPQKAKYWKGLGACLQMKKNYKDALNCYQCAQALLKEMPDAYLDVHSADCYFALKQVEHGLKSLKMAKSKAEKIHDQKILKHVAFMQERWKIKKT